MRIALLLFAAIVSVSAQPARAFEILYATVGTSIRVALFDSATGTLNLRAATAPLLNEIHYVAMHPSRRYLYASTSDRALANAIQAFAVEAQTGALTPMGEPFRLPASLSRAVHIAVDGTGQYLLMAHNLTESVAVMRLEKDGRLGALIDQPEMPKLGFLVHQIRINAANDRVFVPVRGNDAQPTAPEQPGRLHVFSFGDGVLRRTHTIELESGIGPRHLDFHPSRPWVYVLAERGNVLLTYGQNRDGVAELFRTTTLRDPAYTFPAQRAGAIHVHPNGRWLYVTNRNVAPCASSVPCADRLSKPFVAGENNIALFSIDAQTGRPTLVEHVDSHGFEPRTFTFDPSGSFVMVANMMNIARKDGDRVVDVQPNVSVFRIAPDGRLQFVRSHDQPDAGLLWWVGAYELRPRP